MSQDASPFRSSTAEWAWERGGTNGAMESYWATIPPSTGNATPVTYAASSLARNNAAFATSPFFPHSFIGVNDISLALIFSLSMLAFDIAVSVTANLRQQPYSWKLHFLDGPLWRRTSRAECVAVYLFPCVIDGYLSSQIDHTSFRCAIAGFMAAVSPSWASFDREAMAAAVSLHRMKSTQHCPQRKDTYLHRCQPTRPRILAGGR